MKSKIRFLIQYCVLATSFFPINLIYKAIYSCCLATITFSLKKCNKIRSVYLIRGFAKKENIYGLSDIDLMIFIEPGSDKAHTIAKIKGALSRVSSLFLGFPGSLQEAGIVTQEELKTCSAFRIVEGVKTWKLLFGEDIMAVVDTKLFLQDMPYSIDLDLNIWWDYFVTSCGIGNTNPRFLRNYLTFKSTLEIFRHYLFACKQTMTYSRMEAFEIMKGCTAGTQWDQIKADLFRCYQSRFLGKELYSQSLSRFLKGLLAEIYHTIVDRPATSLKKKVRFNTSVSLRDFLPERYSSQILGDIEDFFKKGSKEIQGVSLIPQVEFIYNYFELEKYYRGTSRSDKAEFYPVYLVIHMNDDLSFLLMNDLLKLIDKLHMNIEVFPYQVIGNTAYPMIKNYKRGFKNIKTPFLDPLFFYFASQSAFQISGRGGANAVFNSEALISVIIEQKLRIFYESRQPFLKDIRLLKFFPSGFIRLFLTVMRAKIFLQTQNDAAIHICITPQEIFDRLSHDLPQESEWLRAYEQEILKDLVGMASESGKFFDKALNLLISNLL